MAKRLPKKIVRLSSIIHQISSMPIILQLDILLAQRKIRSKDLAEHVGITEANMSLLKQGKVKGVRFDTLEKICAYLDCQPGDLLIYKPEQPVKPVPEPAK
jgi:putative transcriptional regulator